MLNAIHERKRCNRLIIIPWRNIIPLIPRINWKSPRGRREGKRGSFLSRYHFGVDLGIISGLGIILGAVQRRRHTPEGNSAMDRHPVQDE